jgi:hypothetical protein
MGRPTSLVYIRAQNQPAYFDLQPRRRAHPVLITKATAGYSLVT